MEDYKSNPIQQILVAFASLGVLLVAYVIFGPMIDLVLAGLVIGYPVSITKDIIFVGMKIFIWLVIFAVVARMFLYIGRVTEESEAKTSA
jgi:hypothetical protein